MSAFGLRPFAVLLAVAVWATQPAAPAAQSGLQPLHTTVVAIVNSENPVTQLSMGDLRRVLLGEMTHWPNGKTITIAMRPPGQPERDALFRLVCGLTESDFARYQLRAAYRGESPSGIKVLDTPVGVRRFVFNVPGAIGFVRGDDTNPTVKRLRLTGTVPQDVAFGLTLLAR